MQSVWNRVRHVCALGGKVMEEVYIILIWDVTVTDCYSIYSKSHGVLLESW